MKPLDPPVAKFRSFVTIFGALVTMIYYVFRISGLTSGYLSTAFSIFALLLVLYSLKIIITTLGAGPQKTGFLFIFVGISSSIIGLLLWAYFVYSKQFALAGSLPPYFYYATYLLNFIGFVKLSLNAKTRVQEFMGIITGFSALGLILATLANASNPFILNLNTAGYIIGDALRIIVIALMLQMVIIYQGGLLGRYWLSIFVGNIFIFIANFAASILTSGYSGAAWPYTLIDVIFIGGYLFVAHGFYGIADSLTLALKKISEHRKAPKTIPS